MTVLTLLHNLKYKTTIDDCTVTGVTSDTRAVKEGSLFVCIKGIRRDGHDYAKEALDKGACAVVCERDLGLNRQILVDDTRKAFSLLCIRWYGDPASKMKLIGVTGTNGKTTVTCLLKQMLERFGCKVGLIGTMHNMIGDRTLETANTTPLPDKLQEVLAEMQREGCEYVVMEVSSQALEEERVYGMHFTRALFTNLTQDHLDFHKTMERYFAAKCKLFDMADQAVVNLDDAYGKQIAGAAPCPVLTYSVDTDAAAFTAKNVRPRADGVAFEVLGEGIIGRANIKIPGLFSVYNALCAVACAASLGFDFDRVLAALGAAEGVKGRLEVVPTGRDYTVLIDYAHTPDGLENVLSALRSFTQGRLIALFGCGGDRDKTKRPKMGAVVARYADLAVVTSDNPRSENPAAIIDDILAGMQDSKTPREVIENRRDAIFWTIAHAKPGDVIVLAGKGHETYQILKDGEIHFDEREVVAQALASLRK